ncbi:MAG TPA: hypothetical protein VFO38_05690 [Candidatus Saccharimonadales bacterium]|nr:hypothetical protein [Candidatus Saccharimonadales bacterium]
MRVVTVVEFPEISSLPEGSWVATAKAEVSLYPQYGDTREPRAERPLVRRVTQRVRLLGLTPEDNATCYVVERSKVERGHCAFSARSYMFVADQPFLAVTLFGSGQNRRLCAISQQVQGGQLERYPDISGNLAFQPSQIVDPTDSRHGLHWATLTSVADLIGYSPKDVLSAFAFYSPSSFNYPNVPVLDADDCTKARYQDIQRLYTVQVPDDGFCSSEYRWGGDNVMLLDDFAVYGKTLWIPQELALTAVMLAQFGYRPDGTMPETGCLFEAPSLDVPPHELPVVPPR